MDNCPRGFISDTEFISNFDTSNRICKTCRHVSYEDGMIYCGYYAHNNDNKNNLYLTEDM